MKKSFLLLLLSALFLITSAVKAQNCEIYDDYREGSTIKTVYYDDKSLQSTQYFNVNINKCEEAREDSNLQVNLTDENSSVIYLGVVSGEENEESVWRKVIKVIGSFLNFEVN